MAQILLIGHDASLLATRAAVLMKTNSTVTCSSIDHANLALEKSGCDIAVLCHTLSDSEADELTSLIHLRWPGTRILRVVLASEPKLPASQNDLTSSAEPRQLLHKTMKLLESLPDHRLEIVLGRATSG